MKVELPDNLVREGGEQANRYVLEAVILRAYQGEEISEGKVRELLDWSVAEAERFLAQHRSTLLYTPDDLPRDRAMLAALNSHMKWGVCDTGPLYYLILIGHEDILPRLFPRVVVPPSVLSALRHEGNDAIVRAWAQNPPAWLFIHAPESRRQFPALDAAAGDVLSLLGDSDVSCLLLDDAVGRSLTRREGGIAVGTLCLLARAGKLGWLNFHEALAKLRRASFRFSTELLNAASALLPAGKSDSN